MREYNFFHSPSVIEWIISIGYDPIASTMRNIRLNHCLNVAHKFQSISDDEKRGLKPNHSMNDILSFCVNL